MRYTKEELRNYLEFLGLPKNVIDKHLEKLNDDFFIYLARSNGKTSWIKYLYEKELKNI